MSHERRPLNMDTEISALQLFPGECVTGSQDKTSVLLKLNGALKTSCQPLHSSSGVADTQ